MSDKDISAMLGFDSIDLFVQYFKKHTLKAKRNIKKILIQKIYALEADYFKTYVFPIAAKFNQYDPNLKIKHIRVKHLTCI